MPVGDDFTYFHAAETFQFVEEFAQKIEELSGGKFKFKFSTVQTYLNELNQELESNKDVILSEYTEDFLIEEENRKDINLTENQISVNDETKLFVTADRSQRIDLNTPSSPDFVRDQKDNPMSPFNTRRTAWQRAFGPMNQGSVRGSVFALCAVAIGAGVLSLPYVLAKNGWILGSILILIGAVSGYYSMNMIFGTHNKVLLTLTKMTQKSPNFWL